MLFKWLFYIKDDPFQVTSAHQRRMYTSFTSTYSIHHPIFGLLQRTEQHQFINKQLLCACSVTEQAWDLGFTSQTCWLETYNQTRSTGQGMWRRMDLTPDDAVEGLTGQLLHKPGPRSINYPVTLNQLLCTLARVVNSIACHSDLLSDYRSFWVSLLCGYRFLIVVLYSTAIKK